MNLKEQRNELILDIRKKAQEFEEKLLVEGKSRDEASEEADIFAGDLALRTRWPEKDAFIGLLVGDWQLLYAEFSDQKNPFEDRPRRIAHSYIGGIVRNSFTYRGEIMPQHERR